MPADTSRIIRKLLGLLCFAPLLACSSSSSTTTTISSTFVTVRPSSFRGDVVCGDFPGAWRTYVATLIDVTDPANPLRLASSKPVRCTMPVSFAFVVPEHSYIAEIEGYDRDVERAGTDAGTDPEAGTIVPFGEEDGGVTNGISSGSPRMIDPKTHQDVEPRWKTSCGNIAESTDAEAAADAGDYANATRALYSTDVTVQNCVNFREPATNSFLEIDLADMAIRGALACGADKGQIDHFRIVPEDGTFAPIDVECGREKVPFGPTQAGKNYKFWVSAFEADSGAASWASQCEATAQASVTLPVACSNLSSAGALRIDMAALLAKAQHSCGTTPSGTTDGGTTDVFQYRAVLVGSSKPSALLSCSADAVFSSLSPNSYDVMVDAFDVKGVNVFGAFCTGATIPAQVTTASCQVSP